MAQIDFKALQERLSQNEGGGNFNGPRISYFSLKNHGDEAVVRIMIDSEADFEILAVHSTNVKGKFRKINCIRDYSEPFENCPFCASGEKLQYRLYIKLLEYGKDESGNIVVTPRIWERGAGFANTLKSLMDEYGPLSNIVCKIKRVGAAGSQETTYTVLPANAQVYRDDLYRRMPELFEGYSVLGNAVLDKDYQEMSAMLAGTPATQSLKPITPQPAQSQHAPVASPTTQPVRTYVTGTQAPQAAPTQGTIQRAIPNYPQQPVAPVSNGFGRPTRFS